MPYRSLRLGGPLLQSLPPQISGLTGLTALFLESRRQVPVEVLCNRLLPLAPGELVACSYAAQLRLQLGEHSILGWTDACIGERVHALAVVSALSCRSRLGAPCPSHRLAGLKRLQIMGGMAPPAFLPRLAAFTNLFALDISRCGTQSRQAALRVQAALP